MPMSLTFDRRRHRRFAVHPEYSHLKIRRKNGNAFEGHLYDVSVGGFKFECDGILDAGECFEFEIHLPGSESPIQGQGSVVRAIGEEQQIGPWPTAAKFEQFETRFQAASLTRFIEHGYLVRAA